MLRDLACGLYSRKLRRELSGAALPEHVGLIMDGNRRWARQMGMASPSLGHKYGAEHVEDVLGWCERAGIKHVTVFVCSAENLQRRGDAEIAAAQRQPRHAQHRHERNEEHRERHHYVVRVLRPGTV